MSSNCGRKLISSILMMKKKERSFVSRNSDLVQGFSMLPIFPCQKGSAHQHSSLCCSFFSYRNVQLPKMTCFQFIEWLVFKPFEALPFSIHAEAISIIDVGMLHQMLPSFILIKDFQLHLTYHTFVPFFKFGSFKNQCSLLWVHLSCKQTFMD